jgi:hypothetical protein
VAVVVTAPWRIRSQKNAGSQISLDAEEGISIELKAFGDIALQESHKRPYGVGAVILSGSLYFCSTNLQNAFFTSSHTQKAFPWPYASSLLEAFGS